MNKQDLLTETFFLSYKKHFIIGNMWFNCKNSCPHERYNERYNVKASLQQDQAGWAGKSEGREVRGGERVQEDHRFWSLLEEKERSRSLFYPLGVRPHNSLYSLSPALPLWLAPPLQLILPDLAGSFQIGPKDHLLIPPTKIKANPPPGSTFSLT